MKYYITAAGKELLESLSEEGKSGKVVFRPDKKSKSKPKSKPLAPVDKPLAPVDMIEPTVSFRKVT